MRATADYTIGNTAVRIVDTGRRIRVINVEQEKIRRHFAKRMVIIILSSLLTLYTSLMLVDNMNSKIILDKQIYSLKTEIQQLEHENSVLERAMIDDEAIDYKTILKKARAMGMNFPTNDRVETYQYRRGLGIKLYQAP